MENEERAGLFWSEISILFSSACIVIAAVFACAKQNDYNYVHLYLKTCCFLSTTAIGLGLRWLQKKKRCRNEYAHRMSNRVIIRMLLGVFQFVFSLAHIIKNSFDGVKIYSCFFEFDFYVLVVVNFSFFFLSIYILTNMQRLSRSKNER